MGYGRWDDHSYYSSSSSRKSSGVDDFAYSKTASSVHLSLDPKRIASKPFGKLESRDSTEHPNSNAILVNFDVTGSNFERAKDAQKALPNLMTLLQKYIAGPQVAVAANDDYYVVGAQWAVQLSDFESDNCIDEHIRSIKLVGNGGGNDGESYDLVLYAAARKVVMDCMEKRGRKGYLFLYADEPLFKQVKASQVKEIFGDVLESDIPIEDIIEEAKQLFHVYMLWPVGGYQHARDQFVSLFGKENVITVQHPDRICEVVGITVGINEEKISADEAITDLVAVGVSGSMAASISKSLVPLSQSKTVAKFQGGTVAAHSPKKAARL